MRRFIIKLMRMPAARWWRVMEAAFWLLLARVTIAILPFRSVLGVFAKPTGLLADADRGSGQAGSGKATATAIEIGALIARVGRRLSGRNACMVQAMAARQMLRRRGIPSRIYLGVAKDERNELHSHAWLMSRALFITGESGHEGFRVIAEFGDDAKPRS